MNTSDRLRGIPDEVEAQLRDLHPRSKKAPSSFPLRIGGRDIVLPYPTSKKVQDGESPGAAISWERGDNQIYLRAGSLDFAENDNIANTPEDKGLVVRANSHRDLFKLEVDAKVNVNGENVPHDMFQVDLSSVFHKRIMKAFGASGGSAALHSRYGRDDGKKDATLVDFEIWSDPETPLRSCSFYTPEGLELGKDTFTPDKPVKVIFYPPNESEAKDPAPIADSVILERAGNNLRVHMRLQQFVNEPVASLEEAIKGPEALATLGVLPFKLTPDYVRRMVAKSLGLALAGEEAFPGKLVYCR